MVVSKLLESTTMTNLINHLKNGLRRIGLLPKRVTVAEEVEVLTSLSQLDAWVSDKKKAGYSPIVSVIPNPSDVVDALLSDGPDAFWEHLSGISMVAYGAQKLQDDLKDEVRARVVDTDDYTVCDVLAWIETELELRSSTFLKMIDWLNNPIHGRSTDSFDDEYDEARRVYWEKERLSHNLPQAQAPVKARGRL